MTETKGPSYWDVGTYVQELEARSGRTITWRLLPPRRVGLNGSWTSWGVYLEVWKNGDPQASGPMYTAYFGRNAAWATLPAALHAVLRRYDEHLDERERHAASQATF